MSWYIDGIDVRAGFAVATQRSPDLREPSFSAFGPTAFIAPPSFVPEYVRDRTVGFGLARGTGQIGLFIDDNEVAFSSILDVAEFVRRAYLGGASGDGPDENQGSSPELPPPDEGPLDVNEERGPLEDAEAESTLLRFGEMAMSQSKDLMPGQSHGLDWAALGPLTSRLDHQVLGRGGRLVLKEFCDRRPNANEGETIDKWRICGRRIVRGLEDMGIWSLVVQSESWLQSLGRGLVDLAILRTTLPKSVRPNLGSDRLAELASFPVPMRILQGVGAQEGGVHSILAACVSAPGKFLVPGLDRFAIERAQLTFFAAAYLNCVGTEWEYDRNDNGETYLVRNQLMRRSFDWLRANFPRSVFSSKVEDLIANARRISP